MAYFDCIINRVKAIDDLSENLYSLSLFGSYVRGDYIEGVSDLDFYAVFKEYTEESVNDITLIAEECTQGLKRRHVDVCWSLLEELDDPINKGFPFKILTVYQDDYKENHTLIYGNEIVDLIPSLNQREMIRIRAKSYHELAAQRIETTILKVISGEVIRYMALIHGALSIRKKETYS